MNLKLYLIPFFLVTHHYNFLMKIHGNFLHFVTSKLQSRTFISYSPFLSVGSNHFILVICNDDTCECYWSDELCGSVRMKRKRKIKMRWQRWWWISLGVEVDVDNYSKHNANKQTRNQSRCFCMRQQHTQPFSFHKW